MDQADEGFPKSNRLLSRDEFRKVYEHGQKIHGRFFIAFVLVSGAGSLRIGLTVTRKIGKSVERNRCRRLLREAFRRRRHKATEVGVDIVLNAKRELVSATFADVEAEVNRLLARIQR